MRRAILRSGQRCRSLLGCFVLVLITVLQKRILSWRLWLFNWLRYLSCLKLVDIWRWSWIHWSISLVDVYRLINLNKLLSLLRLLPHNSNLLQWLGLLQHSTMSCSGNNSVLLQNNQCLIKLDLFLSLSTSKSRPCTCLSWSLSILINSRLRSLFSTTNLDFFLDHNFLRRLLFNWIVVRLLKVHIMCILVVLCRMLPMRHYLSLTTLKTRIDNILLLKQLLIQARGNGPVCRWCDLSHWI